MKNIPGIICLFAVLLSSCEKVIDLDYKENRSTIVIEGNITDQTGPYLVKITKSISLTSTDSYPTVDDATVTLSDQAGNTETLTRKGNGTYETQSTKGLEGHTYTLMVNAEGQTYTAQSTMPDLVKFDSLKVEKVVSAGETEYNLIPVYFDPITRGDNYRFVVFVNDKLLNQHFVLNDEIKNGAVNTLRLELNTDDLTLKAGDHIRVKMQCIDAKTALYYKTLSLIFDSSPGGGTTPSNPPGNISNGALGIFSAHTIQEKSVILD